MEKHSAALTDDSRQPSSVTHHPNLVHQASPAASPALFAVSTVRSDTVSVSFTPSNAGWSLSGASWFTRDTVFFPSVSNQGSR